jgi:anthranilate 1,2-dioxygenase small subunit
MSAVMAGFDVNAIARLRVEAFLADYVHALDSDQLEEWPSFFTEDAVYRITTRENHDRGLPLCVMSCLGRGMFVDRISALRTANVFEPHVYCHIPGALKIVAADAMSIEAESTFLVVRTMADGAMSIYACGRSLDRFVDSPDGLRLSKRVVILDSRQIDTLLVIPL